MNVVAPGRLPGIYFQVDAPPPSDRLPRMDIAAFVGFASCGPVDIPVPVEDMERFHDIFGDTLSLAWDRGRGRAVTANLAPAVEAFFRNGGRRCWVVRVAGREQRGRPGATSNRFPLSGLIDARTGGPAVAQARCLGSWSDALRVGTVLTTQVFTTNDFHEDGGTYTLDLLAQDGQVNAGDLLRITFGETLVLFLPVEKITPVIGMVNDVRSLQNGSRPVLLQRISGVDGRWFRQSPGEVASPPCAAASPPHRADTAQVRVVTATSPLHRWASAEITFPATDEERYTIDFEEDLALLPTPGQVLEAHFDDGSRAWLSVAEVVTRIVDASPPVRRVAVFAEEALWPQDPDLTAHLIREAACDPTPTTERLTFEILVWRGREIQARLPDLGFSGHPTNEPPGTAAPPRFWGRLPDDETIFALTYSQPDPPRPGTLEAEVYQPRFPLAAPETHTVLEISTSSPDPDSPPCTPAPAAAASLFVPLGMPDRPDPDDARGRLVLDARLPLERDGLARFDETLLLDEALLDHQLGALLIEANDRLYVQKKPLRGLHSLFPIEEVTLLAVPDAVHRPWELRRPEQPKRLDAPDLLRIDPLDEPGLIALFWSKNATSPSEEPLAYEVQEAPDPAFTRPVVRYAGEDTSIVLKVRDECPQRRYYRVRAVRDSLVSPWSNTRSVVAPRPQFDACDVEPLEAPMLEQLSQQGKVTLRWQPVEAAAYRLEESTDPAFKTARVVFAAARPDQLVHEIESPADFLTHTLRRRLEGRYYYRLRALRLDEVSPWSNTKVFSANPTRVFAVQEPQQFAGFQEQTPGLLAVHRAVIRFCAARADVLAVLSLPDYYQEQTALAHVAALTPDTADDTGLPEKPGRVPWLNFGEERALSYAALYHPWVAVRRDEAIVYVPPDGVASGFIAARTIARGAWVAPANEPLQSVLALDQNFDRAAWQRLLARGVNLVRPDPRGFVLLSAETLSQESDLRPINVRRLLILLRRLALREGNTYVFESNDARLQRRIFFLFRELLSDLYRRGAFAGSTPAAAFQVVVDASINPPESIDRGRLIVELRVAPSRPLTFLTVRLIQRGAEGFLVQEV